MDETVLPKKNTFSLYALRGNTRDSLPLPPFKVIIAFLGSLQL